MSRKDFSWNKHYLSISWEWLMTMFFNKTKYHDDPRSINYCWKLLNFMVTLINFLSLWTKNCYQITSHVLRILKFKEPWSMSVPVFTRQLNYKRTSRICCPKKRGFSRHDSLKLICQLKLESQSLFVMLRL